MVPLSVLGCCVCHVWWLFAVVVVVRWRNLARCMRVLLSSSLYTVSCCLLAHNVDGFCVKHACVY